MAALAIGAPAAQAEEGCSAIADNYTAVVHCYNGNQGTQFQVIVRCPEGERRSLWADQGHFTTPGITMQCHNIAVLRVAFR